MNVIGLQTGHDSSACLFKDGSLIYFNQEERVSRTKKDSGIPYYTLLEILKIEKNIDALIITDYNFNHGQLFSLSKLIKKIGFTLSEIFEVKTYFKSHHLSHAVKAFCSSGFNDAFIFVSDGKGSSFALSNGHESWETTSIYYMDHNNIDCVYKRLYTPGKIDSNTFVIKNSERDIGFTEMPISINENTIFDFRNTYDLGYMYEGTSRSLGFDDEGGKMMGWQSYGQNDNSLPSLLDNDFNFNNDIFEFDETNKQKGFNLKKYPFFADENKRINLAYKVQKAFETSRWNYIEKYFDNNRSNNIILTGGCNLNVVSNYKIRQKLESKINLYSEPICGDEGNCIGGCLMYLKEKTGKFFSINEIYLCGNNPTYDFKLNSNESITNTSDKEIVKLLLDKNIVAVYQGKAESGPRALGNRSILFDPRVNNGKDIVNSVKGRETFRPFACSILEEYASEYFDIENIERSPFMMYAVNCKPDVEKIIPSVIHVDGTCRIQTVNIKDNEKYYNLIKEFYTQTGVPILFNTSFNLAGDPIVETIDDAIDSLRKSKIEYLYLPELNKLIKIPNYQAQDT